MKKGIDVSKWQGVIDWDKVKAAGVEFAIIRGGYGNNIMSQDDPQFERNYSECKRVGIPCGMYLYSYASNTAEALSEAEHALRLMKGKTFEIPCFYDLEDKITGACDNATILEIAKTFIGAVSAVIPCGVYANKYWRLNKLTDAFYNTVPFWLAHYTAKTDYNGKYDLWQYASDGHVNGIAGNVDMNYMYTDFINVAPTPAPAEPAAPTHAHAIGEDVVFSTCYASSTAPNNEAIPANKMRVNHGVITKIVNAKNPYLLNDGLCWVNDGDIRGLYNGAAPTPAPNRTHKAGDVVTLQNTPLYSTATSASAIKHISGRYYLYDGKANNGRYRITTSAANANKEPIGKYVTGWIKL